MRRAPVRCVKPPKLSPLFMTLILMGALSSSLGWAAGKKKERAPASNRPPVDENALVDIKEIDNEKRLRLLLTPEFVYLSNGDKKLMGLVAGVEAQYSLYPKIAVGMSLRQAFSGISSLFFGIDLRFTYAVTGRLRATDRNISVGEMTVFEREGLATGGIHLQLNLTQIFFSNASITLPYVGPGVTIGYESSSDGGSNSKYGIRVDMLSNGILNLMPIQFFYAIAFWL